MSSPDMIGRGAFAAGLIVSSLALAPPLYAKPSDVRKIAALAKQLDAAEHDLQVAEDVSAIRKLQEDYGFFLDKGLWEDISDLFADDARADYPNGTWIGKASIREHIWRNIGDGSIGLKDGRIYNHMVMQPVVDVMPDGKTAKGRWRVLAMIGRLGGDQTRGQATWAGGIYENTYAKENGVWKIKDLKYFPGFSAPYEGGWAKATPVKAGEAPPPPSGPRVPLVKAPDAPQAAVCPGYPYACLQPFHYANPVTGRETAQAMLPGAVPTPAVLPAAEPAVDHTTARLQRRLADVQRRAQIQQDERDIENLQRQYGYYLDRNMWTQIADLFAPDGTWESEQRGVYVGKDHIRKALALAGPEGPQPGRIDDHITLQVVVHVAPDGKTAALRSRELEMGGEAGGRNVLKEGTYENRLVKRNGVWAFTAVHYYLNTSTDFDKGWGQNAQPIATASTGLPPDRPPTEVYQAYPKSHIPPFDFKNPVTGRPIQYSGSFGPDTRPPAAPPAPARASGAGPAIPVAQLETRLAKTRTQIARVRGYDQIQNLESAYGYYLDKNLWDQLADLFVKDGSSMELAQRGAYDGQDHIRAFLHAFGGAEGPHLNQLGDHLNLQSVVLVSPDAKSAKVRARVLQMMGGAGTGASMSGAVYVNTFVNEDGVWKYKDDHAYNTWVINYTGGWAKQTRGTLPGPNKTVPPDRPPSLVFEAFPKTFDLPWNYKNPVTGK